MIDADRLAHAAVLMISWLLSRGKEQEIVCRKITNRIVLHLEMSKHGRPTGSKGWGHERESAAWRR